ncbi:WD40 repeat-like protein [Cantharellus anzutake]|uniref:WD40 repeat-like protein n=1 Tax=Cantharellus anzutake TaxID=1750568 RepID=UPI001906D053|nr:WD40 repeat-like protein [Cantharellus anzutake]KAF8331289.1 WD40 repeat-like protein [Cantharellus anzutake]
MADSILDSPPSDGISSLRFSPVTSDHLLVSSWDSLVRLYDVPRSEVKTSFTHRAAVLSCAFDSTGQFGFSGGLDTWVRKLDLNSEKILVLGAHDSSVASVVHSKDTNSIYTGSWDQTVRVWDPRMGNPKSLVSTHKQPERVYAMDLMGSTLVVATAGRRIQIWDIRDMSKPRDERESSLKFGTSAIACMTDGTVEGRVAVEYFDNSSEAHSRKYAFKCHRLAHPEGEFVYPVNALAFHPTYNTFATGGSDGTVSIWDHSAKKRLRQYPSFGTGISSLAFSGDGKAMAIGVSYNWDLTTEQHKEQIRGNKMDSIDIVIRTVGDEVLVSIPPE